MFTAMLMMEGEPVLATRSANMADVDEKMRGLANAHRCPASDGSYKSSMKLLFDRLADDEKRAYRYVFLRDVTTYMHTGQL